MLSNNKQAFKVRLENEYKAMCAIPINKYLRWKPDVGEKPPHVRKYLVTYTFPYPTGHLGPKLTRKDSITYRFTLDDAYPQSIPRIELISGANPWVPNFYSNGTICPGTIYTASMWLPTWVNRFGQVLAGATDYTNPDSPANPAAAVFFKEHRSQYPKSLPIPVARGYY